MNNLTIVIHGHGHLLDRNETLPINANLSFSACEGELDYTTNIVRKVTELLSVYPQYSYTNKHYKDTGLSFIKQDDSEHLGIKIWNSSHFNYNRNINIHEMYQQDMSLFDRLENAVDYNNYDPSNIKLSTLINDLCKLYVQHNIWFVIISCRGYPNDSNEEQYKDGLFGTHSGDTFTHAVEQVEPYVAEPLNFSYIPFDLKESNDNPFYQKYKKYKMKYLNLKNQDPCPTNDEVD